MRCVFVFVYYRTSALLLVCQKNILRLARCASLYRRAPPCSQGLTTPRSGRWTLTPASAGRTHWWAGPPRTFRISTCVLSGTSLALGVSCLSLSVCIFLPVYTTGEDAIIWWQDGTVICDFACLWEWIDLIICRRGVKSRHRLMAFLHCVCFQRWPTVQHGAHIQL